MAWLLHLSAFLALLVGAISLLGWAIGNEGLTTLGLPGDDPVKASTAIGFVLAATALICASRERHTWATAYSGRLASGIALFLLGAASLGDRLFFIGEFTAQSPMPGPFRMSLNTAVSLTALGLSFMSPPSGEHGVWRLGSRDSSTDPFARSGPLLVGWKWWLAQGFAAFAATIGYIAIIGRAYSADLLYGFSPDVNMALPSALCVFMLGLASFFREADAAFAAEVTSPMPGGLVMRWVVASAAIIIPFIGWLRLLAQDRNVLDYRLGAALFAATSVLLLAGGLWISARRLNHAAALQRFAQIELAIQADLLEERVRTRTEELRTSEAHFRLLTDASPALIWMSDPVNNFEFINSVGSAFFGGSDRALGQRWLESVHDEDRALVTDALTHAARSASSFEFQMRLRRCDGEYRWMHSQGLPRTNSGGELTGFIGASLDVTDSYLAREALRDALANREEALSRETALRRELDHRVRNNLAGLLGLVAFYESASRESPGAHAVVSTLRGKIRAMKEVHEVIARAGGRSVAIDELVKRLVAAMVPDERRASITFIAGSSMRISAQQASALAMIVQELATNSFKHGALLCEQGAISISWRADVASPLILHFEWRERFLPGTTPRPSVEGGMGLTLIEGFARSDLRGTCSFDARPDSWTCSLIAHLDPIAPATQPQQ